MLFPTELEDETLYSLISRLTIINGLSPHQLSICASNNYYSRAADIELDFSLFTSFTCEQYGTKEELIHRYVSNSDLNPIGGYTLIELSNKNKNIWRWCRQCAAEEEKKIGVAYWHSFHQHTSVLTCLKHEIPLLEVNIPFRERQSRFLLPRDIQKLNCQPSCSSKFQSTALAVALIKSKFNQDNLEINDAIVEDMFLRLSLTADRSGLFEHAIKAFGNGSRTLESHIRTELSNPKINRAYLPIKIYVTFGSYEMFKSQYQWHFTMSRGIRLSEDEVYVDLQTRHRNACNSFIAGNPRLTRTDFWKHNLQAARWLSRYDSDWYRKSLPNGLLTAVDHLPKQLSLLTKNKLHY